MNTKIIHCISIVTILSILLGCAATRQIPVSYEVENYAVVPVSFATDRKYAGSAIPSQMFGYEHSQQLTYGVSNVSIPRKHEIGKLESPSIRRFEFRENPDKHVVLLSINEQTKDEFFSNTAKQIKRSAKKQAFIFVHGYNVTFEDAARRTAQISYDLSFDGAPVFYSWPSRGETFAYTVDENMIQKSQNQLKTFLKDFFDRSDAQNIYLIAHSMGNRALTGTLTSLLSENPSFKSRLKEIILAAPDIDADIFKNQIAPILTATGCPVTLYASSEDRPLAISGLLHGYPRAGDSGSNLVILPGIETIDATNISTGFLGHSYFANSPVLSDIYYLISQNVRADQRYGLQAISKESGRYWKFK